MRLYGALIALSLIGGACRHTRYAKGGTSCNMASEDGALSLLGVDTLSGINSIHNVEKGGDNLITRAWLCDHAQKTLDVQYDIVARDNTGFLACDFILRAAERGVRVRLIIDDATVKPNTRQISLLDSHPNIEIKVYNPGIKMGKPSVRARQILRRGNKLHRRMHNKAIIVDNVVAITGGRNIGDEYFDYDEKYNLRDRDILMIGRIAREVTRSFDMFWRDSLCMPYEKVVNYRHKKRYADPSRFDWLHAYACDTSNFSTAMKRRIASYPDYFRRLRSDGEVIRTADVNFISDTPAKNLNRGGKGGITTDSVIAFLRSAKKTVDIHSPYLVLTSEWEAVFRDLASRGVRVRALTNSLASTDNYEAFSAYQRDRKKILSLGVEIHEYKPHPAIRFKIMNEEVQRERGYRSVVGMHAKTFVIDGRTTVIGAYNLDARSANFNSECLAVVRSEAFAANVEKYVEEEFKEENSWQITEKLNGDRYAGLWKRFEAFSRRFMPKKYL